MYQHYIIGATPASTLFGLWGLNDETGLPLSTLLNDLVSYWPLNEQSGTRADAVGSNDLTDNNTVGAVNRGPVGTVASFVQANDEFLSSVYTPGANATYTVVTWHRPSSTGIGGAEEVVTGGSGGDFILRTNEGAINLITSGFGVSNTIATGVIANQWGMLAGYYEHGVGSGVSYNASAWQTAADVATGAWAGTFIGARDATPQDTTEVDGNIASVGIWSRKLSDAEITSLFNSGNGKSYADLTTAEKVDLVSYWNLDEVSGTRVDSHGANDLTDNNTVGSVNSGPSGTVASFVAANSEKLSRAGVDLGLADFTISLWAKTPVSAAAYQEYVSKNNTVDFDLRSYDANYVQFNVNGSSAQIQTDTNWHLIVAYYVDSEKKAYLTIDAGAPTAGSAGTGLAETSSELAIGSATAAYYNNGLIDEVAIWSRVLTAGERTSLFNSGVGKRYSDLTAGEKTGLVSYWNLDEASGTRLDSHGSNDLTDNNTVGSVINAGGAMDGAAASFVALNTESLSIVENSLWNGDTSTTIAAWVYRNALIGVDIIASRETGGTRSILLRGDGAAADVSLFTRDYNDSVTKSGALTAGSWHLVIAWHDAALNEIGVQVDNTTPATAATGGANTTPNGTFFVGARDGNTYLDGKLDEVAIWSRVLTADERTELFAAGAGKFYPFPL